MKVNSRSTVQEILRLYGNLTFIIVFIRDRLMLSSYQHNRYVEEWNTVHQILCADTTRQHK